MIIENISSQHRYFADELVGALVEVKRPHERFLGRIVYVSDQGIVCVAPEDTSLSETLCGRNQIRIVEDAEPRERVKLRELGVVDTWRQLVL